MKEIGIIPVGKIAMAHSSILQDVVYIQDEEDKQQAFSNPNTVFTIEALSKVVEPYIQLRKSKPHKFTKQVKTSYKRMK